MTYDKRIDSLNAMKLRLAAATTMTKAVALYVDWIGYDPLENEPNMTCEEIYETLDDYILEMGHALGVHRNDLGSF